MYVELRHIPHYSSYFYVPLHWNILQRQKTLPRDSRLPENIEWFIEDHAFSPSYDLAPPNPPAHLQKLSLFLSLPVCRLSRLLTGEG